MADGHAALAQREKARGDELATAAAQRAAGAITATLATAARLAVEAVQADQGRGTIGEAAADLREIRTNPKLLGAREHDLASAEAQAAGLLIGALANGFADDAHGRAELMAPKLVVTVKLTATDAADLRDYPIQGRTPAEMARRLRQMLGDAIDEILARPLTGAIDPATIPAALGDAARLHSERVANAVAEAYAAGVQAATAAIGRALVGG